MKKGSKRFVIIFFTSLSLLVSVSYYYNIYTIVSQNLKLYSSFSYLIHSDLLLFLLMSTMDSTISLNVYKNFTRIAKPFFSAANNWLPTATRLSSIQSTWQLFRFLLNKKTKEYYDNCIDELTIDLIEARKFRKKYKRNWCAICLWMRTFVVFLECLRIQGWAWALNLLLPPALRNWFSRLGK